jgi:hypothetical protein
MLALPHCRSRPAAGLDSLAWQADCAAYKVQGKVQDEWSWIINRVEAPSKHAGQQASVFIKEAQPNIFGRCASRKQVKGSVGAYGCQAGIAAQQPLSGWRNPDAFTLGRSAAISLYDSVDAHQ